MVARSFATAPGVYISETATASARSYMLGPGVFIAETTLAITSRRPGGWDREIESEVKRLRTLRKKDDRERREAEQRLTGLIEAAYNRALGIEPDVADEIAAAAVDAEQARPRRAEEIDQPLVRYDWNALARHLDGLDALLERMDARKADEAEKRAVALAVAAEEDDIEMLLMVV